MSPEDYNVTLFGVDCVSKGGNSNQEDAKCVLYAEETIRGVTTLVSIEPQTITNYTIPGQRLIRQLRSLFDQAIASKTGYAFKQGNVSIVYWASAVFDRLGQ